MRNGRNGQANGQGRQGIGHEDEDQDGRKHRAIMTTATARCGSQPGGTRPARVEPAHQHGGKQDTQRPAQHPGY